MSGRPVFCFVCMRLFCGPASPVDAEGREEAVLGLIEDAMEFLGTDRPCAWCEALRYRN